MSSSAPPLFILYGSATGNAEHIAKTLAERAQNDDNQKIWSRVVCAEANAFKKQCVPLWENNETMALLVVCSTTGNGDAPENASRFTRFIKRKTTSATLLTHTQYAVLALGDTNYDQFCASGKLVNKRLRELGGTAVQAVACADEGTGLEQVVDPWMESILDTMARAFSSTSNEGAQARESVVNGEGEDGKADKVVRNTGDTSEPKPQSTDAASDMLNQTTLQSPGVQTLRSLLKLQPHEPLPAVEPDMLPSLTKTRFSSCSLLDNDVAAADAAENTNTAAFETKSVSTASSGFFYTAQRPFSSTIRNARYLTHQTSTKAAQQVADVMKKQDDNGERNGNFEPRWMSRANEIYNQEFPLESGSDNDIERNGKRVIEMTMSLPDDYTLEYAPGDSLGLLVDNTPTAVNFVLNMLKKHHNISAEQKVVIGDNNLFEGTVQEAITSHYIDLSSTNPVQSRLLRNLAQFTNDTQDRLALELLASKNPKQQALFQTMVEEQRWNLVDLLQAFPSLQPSMTLDNLFALLPQIPPRYYSVSSSPTLSHELTVTFAVVDYLTPPVAGTAGASKPRRRIHGLATRYLENLCSPFLCIDQGQQSTMDTEKLLASLRIFPKPTADFRLPPPTVSNNKQPLVFIGPGTGIAPFVGFLRHMQATQQEARQKAQTMVEGTWRGDYQVSEQEVDQLKEGSVVVGANQSQSSVPSVYVFFGCRHQEHDYLYKEDLAEFVQKGLITELHTAFSRDGGEGPKYVQDAMLLPPVRERLGDLMVQQHARVYLCGDGNRMAKDVQKTLSEDILGEHGGALYLEKMKESKHFLLDIWS